MKFLYMAWKALSRAPDISCKSASLGDARKPPLLHTDTRKAFSIEGACLGEYFTARRNSTVVGGFLITRIFLCHSRRLSTFSRKVHPSVAKLSQKILSFSTEADQDQMRRSCN